MCENKSLFGKRFFDIAVGIFLPLFPTVLCTLRLGERTMLPIFYLSFFVALLMVNMTWRHVVCFLGLTGCSFDEGEQHVNVLCLESWQMRGAVLGYWMLWSGFFYVLFMAGD